LTQNACSGKKSLFRKSTKTHLWEETGREVEKNDPAKEYDQSLNKPILLGELAV